MRLLQFLGRIRETIYAFPRAARENKEKATSEFKKDWGDASSPFQRGRFLLDFRFTIDRISEMFNY